MGSILNNEQIYKKHMEYLKAAGVDGRVLEYLKKKYFLIVSKLNEILGDIFPGNDAKYIELLKNGSDTFRITEDGGIWMTTEQDKDAFKRIANDIKIGGQRFTFYHGPSIEDETLEKLTDYHYLQGKDNNIIHQRVGIKHRKRNDVPYYSGDIVKEVFGLDNVLKERYTCGWGHEKTSDIPSGELTTTQEKYECDWRFPETSSFQFDYSIDPEWQFVMSGKTQGERILQEIDEQTIKGGISFENVGKFFGGLLEKFKGNSR